ncbi:PAS domain-containing protein [Chloroflexota bacterium]
MEQQADYNDVTSRKQVEAGLLESETLFRYLADFTYDWEYWLNPKGKLVYISPSCERISGYSPDEYLGNPNLIQEIIHPDDLPIFVNHLLDKHREKSAFSLEFRIRTRDGQERWIEHHCQPVINGNGVYLGERASNRDVTDQKEIEAKLQEGTRRLRQEVKRRKKVHEELQALYKHLNRVQEDERLAIGRELHDEIGQNLTALNIALTRAARSVGQKVDLELENAQSLVVEVLSQVHNLLQNIRLPVVERMGLLPSLIYHFNRYEALTEVKVNFEHAGLETGVPAEVSDTAYHIIQEALTNVARHAGVKRATVRLRATQRNLSILVQDKGIGFDSIAMAEVTTTGLSSMRERAETVGAQLKINSSPGFGTRVYVELPLTIAQRRESKES